MTTFHPFFLQRILIRKIDVRLKQCQKYDFVGSKSFEKPKCGFLVEFPMV